MGPPSNPLSTAQAICSIIYASQRISGDLPELATLRNMLASKYSGLYKDFAVAAASDTHYREWQVNETLAGCLSVEAPSPEQKIAVLESISAESGAPFDAAAARAEMGQSFVAPPPRPAPGTSAASSSTQGVGGRDGFFYCVWGGEETWPHGVAPRARGRGAARAAAWNSQPKTHFPRPKPAP